MRQSHSGDLDLARFEHDDDSQVRAAEGVRKALPYDIKLVEIDRTMLAQFLFEPHDLVVAVGQDGLVANVGKYLEGQPLVGVNPDPDNIDGSLLAFTVDTFVKSVSDLLHDRRPIQETTLAD